MSELPPQRERLLYILGIVIAGSGIFDAFERGAMPFVGLHTGVLIVNSIGMRWHGRWPVLLPVALAALNGVIAFWTGWSAYSSGSTAIHWVWWIAGVGFVTASLVFALRGRRRAEAPPARAGFRAR